MTRRVRGDRAVRTLLRRELLRQLRQPSRVAASVGTALLIWLFLGAGLAGSVRGRGADAPAYAAFLVPGMACLSVLFSAIFSAISLIEDRESGFLQGVLVSPAPRWSIAASKIAGAALPAAAQGLLVVCAAPLAGVPLDGASLAWSACALALIGVAVSGLALAAAWRAGSVAGFHAVMNLVLMPMWLLSGAMFPAEGAAPGMRAILRLNPLTHALQVVRAALHGQASDAPWLLLVLFACAGAGAAWAVMARGAPARPVA